MQNQVEIEKVKICGVSAWRVKFFRYGKMLADKTAYYATPWEAREAAKKWTN